MQRNGSKPTSVGRVVSNSPDFKKRISARPASGTLFETVVCAVEPRTACTIISNTLSSQDVVPFDPYKWMPWRSVAERAPQRPHSRPYCGPVSYTHLTLPTIYSV